MNSPHKSSYCHLHGWQWKRPWCMACEIDVWREVVGEIILLTTLYAVTGGAFYMIWGV